MQGNTTLYEVLEVSPTACPQVIRAAFRALAQCNHPDKKSGSKAASERQAQINHAYSVLSDPDRRQRYDQAIALRKRFTERRGAAGLVHSRLRAGESARQEPRPFAFRPLL